MNDEIRARYALARRGAVVGAWANVALAAGKMVVGLSTGSLGLLADALHSLSDVLTSAVAWVGLRIAERPADENHPYGHMRAETVAAAAIAGPLVLSGVLMASVAGRGLFETRPVPGLAAAGAALVAALLKEGLFQWKVRIGRRTGSRAILADAWHHRSDALSSWVVLLGALLARLGGAWIRADAAAGIVVSAFVAVVGWRVLRGTIGDLMDEQPGGEIERQVRAVAGRHPEVVDVEKVRIRRGGLEYSVDLHLEFPPDMAVDLAHGIGHEVVDEIQAEMPEVRNVLVHVEPAGGVG